jgi:hypothetical protein
LPPSGETTIQRYDYLLVLPKKVIHMAIDIKHPYTLEELYNNYEFKVVKRALMKQYPWIKDITVDPDQLAKYNLIFLNFDIDPAILAEEMGWELNSWVKTALDKGEMYNGLYLSLFFRDLGFDDTKFITNEMEKTFRDINRSPALPHDLKLKGERRFSVGDFVMNRGGKSWF